MSEGGGFRVEDVVGFADGDFERWPVACTRKRHEFETALTEPCCVPILRIPSRPSSFKLQRRRRDERRGI